MCRLIIILHREIIVRFTLHHDREAMDHHIQKAANGQAQQAGGGAFPGTVVGLRQPARPHQVEQRVAEALSTCDYGYGFQELSPMMVFQSA